MTGLVFARLLARMSTEDLANKLGVSRSLVSGWENGLKNIPEKRKEELEEILCVDKEVLQEEIGLEQEFEIWARVHLREIKQEYKKQMSELMSNLQDAEKHTLLQDMDLLLNIELLKFLQDFTKSSLEIINSKDSSMKKQFVEFFYYINFATKRGGQYVTDLMKNMEEKMDNHAKQSIAYWLEKR